MGTHVDESCTFNLKPNRQDVAASYEACHMQLECDIMVCQRSDQTSGVVIRAVHEVAKRQVQVCVVTELLIKGNVIW